MQNNPFLLIPNLPFSQVYISSLFDKESTPCVGKKHPMTLLHLSYQVQKYLTSNHLNSAFSKTQSVGFTK